MMEKTRSKYSEIVLLHCIGVIMIFCGHVAQKLNYLSIGEILISGVPLFLFVAGFLAGKSKSTSMVWLGKRAKRILIPYYFLLLVIFVLCLILQEPSLPKQWLFLFTDLQGLSNFVFFDDGNVYYAPMSSGLGHFWFVTIIMMCYTISVIVNCVWNNSIFLRNHWKILMLFSYFLLQPLLVFYGATLNSFNIFLFGFFIAKEDFLVTRKKMVIFTVILIGCLTLRLACRQYFDDSRLYNHYIAGIASNAIGLWIVAFVFYIRKVFPVFIDRLSKLNMVVFLESICYEIFLVHHIFVKGSWSVFNYIANPICAVIVVVILTLVISYILHLLSQKLIKAI